MEKLEKLIKHSFIYILKFFIRVKKVKNFSFGNVKKILVIRQHNELGDMLCVVPLLRALKNNIPDVQIDLITRRVNNDIMLNNPFLRKVIEYNSKKYLRSPFSIFEFLKKIRREKYDLAITPVTVSVSFTSDLLAFFSKSKVRIGPNKLNKKENLSGFLYNIPVDLIWSDKSLKHQTERNLDILSEYKIFTKDLSLTIGLTEDEKKYGRRFIEKYNKSGKISIGIHSGAGKIENQWDSDLFIELIGKLLSEINSVIFLTCGPKDIEPVEKIRSVYGDEVFVIKEKSIRNVAAIIDNFDLFITNDTGVMHVAASTHCPVLSLFGPTDPLQWAPQRKCDKYILGSNGNVNTISVDKVFHTSLKMLTIKINNQVKN